MTAGAAAPVPPRGTRPRNRRELIIAAAADLFHRDGYERVAVSDVAAAVNVRPSALYRHASGKPELLTAVVLAEIEPFRRALAGDTLDRVLPALVRAGLEHPRLGVLWQREARSLPAAQRAVIRAELRALGDELAGLLAAERPEIGPRDAHLLSWCAWAVLHSVGRGSVDLPPAEYAALLEDLLRTVTAHVPRPADPATTAAAQAAAPADGGFAPQAKRERLLAAAVPLFAAQGYAAVSMDDIGARVGITGPSVYHHFTAKDEILYAALVRGDEWLRHDMNRALAAAADPADALRRLADSYADLAAGNSALIDVLISEVRHLPEGRRARIARSQQDYLGEWQHLLCGARPDMPAMQARARIHAALTVVNDIARTRRLRSRPDTLTTAARLAHRILLDE